MPPAFDYMSYLSRLKLNRANGLALSDALLTAPKPQTAGVAAAAERLRAAASQLKNDWSERARTEADPASARPADHAIDNAWSSLHGRLEAYASLPVERYPGASRAEEIIQALFGDGLTFLLLPFLEEYAHSGMLLGRIDAEKLAADIDRLAGPEFLAEVRLTHKQYGDALGVTRPNEVGPKVNLTERLKDLSSSVVDYSLQVLATADATKPETIQAVRAALAPIDELRANRHKPKKTPTPTPPAPGT